MNLYILTRDTFGLKIQTTIVYTQYKLYPSAVMVLTMVKTWIFSVTITSHY